jgi:hypothetical protein
VYCLNWSARCTANGGAVRADEGDGEVRWALSESDAARFGGATNATRDGGGESSVARDPPSLSRSLSRR